MAVKDNLTGSKQDYTGEIAAVLSHSGSGRFLIDVSKAKTLYMKQISTADTVSDSIIYGFPSRDVAIKAATENTETIIGTKIATLSGKTMKKHSFTSVDVSSFMYIGIVPSKPVRIFITLGKDSVIQNCLMIGKAYMHAALNSLSHRAVKISVRKYSGEPLSIERQRFPYATMFSDPYGVGYNDNTENSVLGTISGINSLMFSVNKANGAWVRTFSAYSLSDREQEIEFM